MESKLEDAGIRRGRQFRIDDDLVSGRLRRHGRGTRRCSQKSGLMTESDGRSFVITDIVDALAQLNVHRGDTVVMHSSLMHLGRPSDSSLSEYPKRVIEAITA